MRELGTYNAEKARGIMHAPEWQNRMAELQEEFDSVTRSVREQLSKLAPQGK